MVKHPIVIGFLVTLMNIDASSSASGGGDSEVYSLTMTSVMLYHKLSWSPPDVEELGKEYLTYTVLYSYDDEDDDEWENMEHCSNITETFCEIDKGSFSFAIDNIYLFVVKGRVLGSEEIIYKTENISFNAFESLHLVAPNITMKFHGDLLFLYPQPQYHWTGSLIGKQEGLENIVYQIEYWTTNETDKIHSTTTENLDSEIQINIEHPEEYCARVRLYIAEVGLVTRRTNVFSDWSDPPTCVQPEGVTPSSPKVVSPHSGIDTIVKICIGIGGLLALLIFSYFVYKVRKIRRFINLKVAPPDILMAIIKDDSESRNNQEQQMTNFMSQEIPDSLSPTLLECKKNSVPDLIPESEREPLMVHVPLTYLDVDRDFDDYLQLGDANLPVFNEDATTSANVQFNMTYGIGTTDDDNQLLDIEDTLLGGISFCERLEMPRAWLSSSFSGGTESGTPNRNDPFLPAQLSLRRPTISLSSSGSEPGLIFDIQRSENPTRNNFYLGRSPYRTENYMTERFNIAYSSNPQRDTPDILIRDYINEIEKHV